MYVLSRVTRTMQRDPMLTEAMTRAFMFADPSAAAEVNTVAKQMVRMFTRAMHDGEPSADDIAIARVIGDVWLSNLVAWVTQAGVGGRRVQPPRARRPPAAALIRPACRRMRTNARCSASGLGRQVVEFGQVGARLAAAEAEDDARDQRDAARRCRRRAAGWSRPG